MALAFLVALTGCTGDDRTDAAIAPPSRSAVAPDTTATTAAVLPGATTTTMPAVAPVTTPPAPSFEADHKRHLR